VEQPCPGVTVYRPAAECVAVGPLAVTMNCASLTSAAPCPRSVSVAVPFAIEENEPVTCAGRPDTESWTEPTSPCRGVIPIGTVVDPPGESSPD